MACLVYYLELLDIRPEKHSVFALVFGLCSCLFLLSLKIKSKLLARIGVYSYSIYLLHVFFTAGTRIVLHAVNVDVLAVLYFSSLTAGVLGPIFVEVVLRRFKFTSMVLLGKTI